MPLYTITLSNICYKGVKSEVTVPISRPVCYVDRLYTIIFELSTSKCEPTDLTHPSLSSQSNKFAPVREDQIAGKRLLQQLNVSQKHVSNKTSI